MKVGSQLLACFFVNYVIALGGLDYYIHSIAILLCPGTRLYTYLHMCLGTVHWVEW